MVKELSDVEGLAVSVGGRFLCSCLGVVFGPVSVLAVVLFFVWFLTRKLYLRSRWVCERSVRDMI